MCRYRRGTAVGILTPGWWRARPLNVSRARWCSGGVLPDVAAAVARAVAGARRRRGVQLDAVDVGLVDEPVGAVALRAAAAPVVLGVGVVGHRFHLLPAGRFQRH